MGRGRKHPLLEEQDASHRNHVIRRILGHEEGHMIWENYWGIFGSLKKWPDGPQRATGTCRELCEPENQRGPTMRGLVHTAEHSPHTAQQVTNIKHVSDSGCSTQAEPEVRKQCWSSGHQAALQLCLLRVQKSWEPWLPHSSSRLHASSSSQEL